MKAKTPKAEPKQIKKHNFTHFIILDADGVKTDYNDWNTIKNKFNSKQYTPKNQPPKNLLNAVIEEFKEFCKAWHIDLNAYKFIKPGEIEGEWRQFDFLDDIKKRYPSVIQIHSIIARDNGEIAQRIIDLGH